VIYMIKKLLKILNVERFDYMKIKKNVLRDIGEEGRKIVRLFIEKDKKIMSLEDKIKFINDNLYNFIDLVENENDIKKIMYIIYELLSYSYNNRGDVE